MKWLQLSGAGSGGAAAGPTNAGFWILLSPYLTPLSTSHNVLVGLNSSDLSFGSGGSIVTSASLVSVTASVNASVASLAAIAGSYVALNSYHTGSGTNLPMAFFTGGAERMRLLVAGNWLWGQTADDGSTMAVQIKGGISLSGNASGNYLGRIWISTDTSQGQNAGTPGVAGPGTDNTAIDNNGFEGNFFRIKSHTDYFDLTVWNPILASGPLAAHTLQLRDSSNNVLEEYSNASGNWYGGQFLFNANLYEYDGNTGLPLFSAISQPGPRGYLSVLNQSGAGGTSIYLDPNSAGFSTIFFDAVKSFRRSSGHMQWSDDGTTWTSFSSIVNYWTLSSTLLYPNSTSYVVLVGGTVDDGSGAVFQVTGSAAASGIVLANEIMATTDINASVAGSYIALTVGALSQVSIIAGKQLAGGTFLPMTFLTGGSERMRLDTSGNLGIGSTSPAARLHVYSTTSADGIMIDGTTAPALTMANAGTAVSHLGVATAVNQYFVGTAISDIALRSDSQNLFLGSGSSTPNMVLNSSGHTLVGAAADDSSGAILQVHGSVNLTATSLIEWGGTGYLRYSGGHLQGSDDGATWVNLTGLWSLGSGLYPNSTSYNVYIGATADDGTTAKLQVNGAISAQGAIISQASIECNGAAGKFVANGVGGASSGGLVAITQINVSRGIVIGYA